MSKIGFLFFTIFICFTNSLFAEEVGLKAICSVNFIGDNAPCAASTDSKVGSVQKSAVVSIGSRMFVVKFDTTGKRSYEEILENKKPVVISESESTKLDNLYNPSKEEPVTFNCAEERSDCRIPDKKIATNAKCSDENQVTSSIQSLTIPIQKLSKEASCSKTRQIELMKKPCDGKNSLQVAGGCLANILKGGFKSITDTGKFMYDLVVGAVKLPVNGIDWISKSNYSAKIQKTADKPEKYISDWWTSTEKAENDSSDAMALVSQVDKKTLEKTANEFKKAKSTEPTPGMLKRFADYMTEAITINYGCLKWSGLPHAKGSKCIQPWTSWACADCSTKANLLCGTAGFIVGEVGSAVLLGGFFKYLATGAKVTLKATGKGADKVQAMLSKTSKKIPTPEEFSVFQKGVQVTSKGVTVIGEKIDSAKSTAGKFLMTQLKTAGQILENKLPPPKIGALASTSMQSPTKAASWYWNKLELAYAKGLGGEAKRVEVAKEQAEAQLDNAKASYQLATNQAHKEDKTVTYATQNAQADLAKAEENFYKARASADTHDLKNLRENFATTIVESQIEIAKKSGTSLSGAQIKKIADDAILAGEAEQGKNLLIAYKGVEIINKMPTANVAKLKEEIAPVIHESWQSTRKASHEAIDQWIANENKRISQMSPAESELFQKIASDTKKEIYPEYLPRIKPVTSAKVYDKDGAVDIANTQYDKLPSYWQADNQVAGENIINELTKYKNADGQIASKTYDKISSQAQVSDPTYLNKVGRIYNDAKPNEIIQDPLVIAAAREHNKWKARTGTSYSNELQLVYIVETISDLSDKKDATSEIIDTVRGL